MKFKIGLIFFSIAFFFLFANNLLAGECWCNNALQSYDQAECQSFIQLNPNACIWYPVAPPSGAGGTTPSSQSVQLPNPLGTPNPTPQTLLGRIINAVLGITGSLALVMFIYGGTTWMLSAGNAEQVSKGKNIIIWATIGLVIIFSAYALVKFIFTSLGAPQ